MKSINLDMENIISNIETYNEDLDDKSISIHMSDVSESSSNESEDEEVLGTSGLYNLGNTCYMNSIVQCLSNCDIFRNIILSNNLIPKIIKDKEVIKKHISFELDNSLCFQLRKIFINIWNSSFFSFRPISFKKLFGKKIEMFQNSAQHDSQEALLCILDTLNEEIGSETFLKSNNSIFDDKIKYLLDKDELDDIETKNLINLIKSNEEQYVNFISQNDFTKFYKKKYSFICNMFGGRIISGLNCPITNISKSIVMIQSLLTISLIVL